MKNRRSWIRETLFLFICMLALLAESPQAIAGPMAPDDGCLTDNVCRSRYDHAVKLFEGGSFEKALAEFQSAYDRRQMPWLLINIGRTLHRLGRPREALEYYDRYKQAETKSDPETQERLEKYVTQARALVAENPTATPTPTAPPSETPVVATTTTPPTAEKKPIYKKWWFWTAIGGGVAAVVIIGVAAGVATASSGPTLPSGIMTLSFK